MNKLNSLAAALTKAGIVVVKIEPSTDLDQMDHEIVLEKGFCVQVPVGNEKPLLWRCENEKHWMNALAPNRAVLIEQIKTEMAKVKEVRHIIQVTTSKGEWKDYAPGSDASLGLEKTLEIAKALKPDGRRMKVLTFTETESHEV
jgi:hypothetical protein